MRQTMRKGESKTRVIGIVLALVVIGALLGDPLSDIEFPHTQASSDLEVANEFTGVDTQPSQQYNALPSPTVNHDVVNQETISEDPFDYQGEYVIDHAELNGDENAALTHVQKYAQEQAVSPALLMALIKQESSFDPDVIGDGGLAIGYMQLHWDAAYDAGYRSNRDTSEDYTDKSKNLAREDWPIDGLDPDANVKYGCGYLKICYNKHKDSSIYDTPLKNAVSAYNLGWPHGPDKSNKTSYVNPVLEEYEHYIPWVEKAIAWAYQDQPKVMDSNHWWDPEKKMGFCMAFVSDAFKVWEDRPRWPNELKKALDSAGEFHSKNDNEIPPRGALVFFSIDDDIENCKGYTEYGHVGISLGNKGNEKVIHAYGQVREETIDKIEDLSCIDSYLGWAYPPKQFFSHRTSDVFREGDIVYKEKGWKLRDIPSCYGDIVPNSEEISGKGEIIGDTVGTTDANGICNGGICGVHYWWHVRIGDIEAWCAEDALSRPTSAEPISTSDIVLVMDASGSMDDEWQGETKLSSAKNGANEYCLGQMQQGTTLAVVTFAGTAHTLVTLTSDFSAVKVAIEDLGAGGNTDIGDALTEALFELGAHSEDSAAKAIVLFTDGHITTGMSEDEVMAGPVKDVIDRQIVIHTIGYGDPSYLHSEFLREMAESTGGKYYDATEVFQLQNAFIEAGQRAEAWDIEATFVGRVKHQETVIAGTFDLASRVGSLKVTLNWPGSNLDLHIIDPRGREVDYQASRVTCSGDIKPEYVVIEKPCCGIWTIKVHGMAVSSETEYCLWIATHAAPPASGSLPTWVLPLLVGIVLIPILAKHISRQSERSSS